MVNDMLNHESTDAPSNPFYLPPLPRQHPQYHPPPSTTPSTASQRSIVPPPTYRLRFYDHPPSQSQHHSTQTPSHVTPARDVGTNVSAHYADLSGPFVPMAMDPYDYDMTHQARPVPDHLPLRPGMFPTFIPSKSITLQRIMTPNWLQQYLDRVREVLRRRKLMATLGPQTYNGRSIANAPPSPPVPMPETFGWQWPSSFTDQLKPAAPKIQRPCLLCLEKFDEDLMPYKCHRCTSYTYCSNCLKSWFLDACKNESKMPPKCCSAIPVSSVASLLTTAQVELYKAKFEEWSTVDRLYCAVKTCSAFIPPRLYVKPTVSFKVTEHRVSCPKCGTSVCTKCRSMAHVGDCPESDLDPALEEQLKKWKIKRCPKCRTGIRKVFGCNHVECRCGAHFCWECLLPISQCDGSCEDESENEPDGSEPEEDDLDGRAGYHDGDEHDFGPEPYGSAVDPWSCQPHSWIPLKPTLNVNDQLECQSCFRSIDPSAAPGTSGKTDHDGGGDVVMSGTPTTNQWQCAGAHMTCLKCPRPPPETANERPVMSYGCWCGEAYCPICNRNEKLKELEMWNCRCGMIVCGACKNNLEMDS